VLSGPPTAGYPTTRPRRKGAVRCRAYPCSGLGRYPAAGHRFHRVRPMGTGLAPLRRPPVHLGALRLRKSLPSHRVTVVFVRLAGRSRRWKPRTQDLLIQSQRFPRSGPAFRSQGSAAGRPWVPLRSGRYRCCSTRAAHVPCPSRGQRPMRPWAAVDKGLGGSELRQGRGLFRSPPEVPCPQAPGRSGLGRHRSWTRGGCAGLRHRRSLRSSCGERRRKREREAFFDRLEAIALRHDYTHLVADEPEWRQSPAPGRAGARPDDLPDPGRRAAERRLRGLAASPVTLRNFCGSNNVLKLDDKPRRIVRDVLLDLWESRNCREQRQGEGLPLGRRVDRCSLPETDEQTYGWMDVYPRRWSRTGARLGSLPGWRLRRCGRQPGRTTRPAPRSAPRGRTPRAALPARPARAQPPRRPCAFSSARLLPRTPVPARPPDRDRRPPA
jgi:hypothetical protein